MWWNWGETRTCLRLLFKIILMDHYGVDETKPKLQVFFPFSWLDWKHFRQFTQVVLLLWLENCFSNFHCHVLTGYGDLKQKPLVLFCNYYGRTYRPTVKPLREGKSSISKKDSRDPQLPGARQIVQNNPGIVIIVLFWAGYSCVPMKRPPPRPGY